MTQQIDHASRGHVRLSPSSTSRWWNCPGSVAATQGMVSKSSWFAREGTAAHELAEECLQKGLNADAYLGQMLEDEFEVDEAFAEAVQLYLDTCREYMTEGWEFWFERRITLADLNPPEEIAGTADFSAYNRELERLVGIDFKFGKGIAVEAENNPQVKVYVLGVWLALPHDYPVKVIENVIVQPRVPYGEPIKRADIDPYDLLMWSAELLMRAEDTQKPDAPRKTGSWCRFCLISGKCDQQAKETFGAVNVAFDDFLLSPEPAKIKLPELRTLTPEQIAHILEAAPKIKAFVEAVQQTAKESIENGFSGIPGWKVVPSRPTTSWTAADTETAGALQTQGLSPEELWTQKLVSFAKARDLLADKIRNEQGATAKAAKEMAAAALAPYTFTSSKGTTLVPSTDSRPSIQARGDEFDALTLPAPK